MNSQRYSLTSPLPNTDGPGTNSCSISHGRRSPSALRLQIAQNRSHFYALGPKVGVCGVQFLCVHVYIYMFIYIFEPFARVELGSSCPSPPDHFLKALVQCHGKRKLPDSALLARRFCVQRTCGIPAAALD